MQVLRNDYQGVKGNFTITITWCISAPASQWEAQLPADTKAELTVIKADPAGYYRDLPNINTLVGSFARPSIVSLITQQMTWGVLQAQGLLSKYITTGK